jgi:precorrin-2 dehydrogenase
MTRHAGYYPIALAMAGRPCVVIGGGPVAEGKVEDLLAVGARVTVVSPVVTERLASLVRAGQITHQARAYGSGDLEGCQIAFVAVGDSAVAEQVALEARKRGVWVNTADDPPFCDFILPSVLRRGRLAIAVSTGGASPALARAIREELEERITDDYGLLVELVADVRQELRGRPGAPSPEAWRHALAPDLRRLIADGRGGEAKARLRARLRTPA